MEELTTTIDQLLKQSNMNETSSGFKGNGTFPSESSAIITDTKMIDQLYSQLDEQKEQVKQKQAEINELKKKYA